MTLIDLSDISLQTIFQCLDNNFTSKHRLSKVAFKLRAAFRAVRAKPTVQAIRLYFEKSKFTTTSKSFQPFTCERYATHLIKDTIYYTYPNYLLIIAEYTSDIYSIERLSCPEVLAIFDAHNIEGKELVNIAFHHLLEAFNKVESTRHLEISHCLIDDNFVANFAILKDYCSSIRGLHLLECVINLSAEKFREFFQLFDLDSIRIRAQLSGAIVDDEIIASLSNVIEIRCFDSYSPNFTGITDRTLTSWTETLPKHVYLAKARTGFTLMGLCNFVLALKKLTTHEQLYYCLGMLDKVGAKDGCRLAQSERDIKWTMRNDSPRIINHTLRFQNDIVVEFLVDLHLF